jgi:hypothetical protein
VGGFVIGLVETGDISDGAVSSSFALEQIGIPRRTIAGGGSEFYNGDSVCLRLGLYRLSSREDVMDIVRCTVTCQT